MRVGKQLIYSVRKGIASRQVYLLSTLHSDVDEYPEVNVIVTEPVVPVIVPPILPVERVQCGEPKFSIVRDESQMRVALKNL
jgi:hypothetical protein